MSVDLKLYNIELVDITDLLSAEIIREWIDYLHDYSLLEGNKSTKSKLFYHFFIKKVCDTLLESDTLFKKIIFLTLPAERVSDIVLKNRISQSNMSEIDFLNMLRVMITKIERNFPLKFIISSKKYNDYLKYLNKTPGKVNFLRLKVEKVDISKYSYNKILKFTKKYDLSWLNENYFSCIKAKLLLLS